jgi:transcriptional regulator with XRE-family HTH domain
MKKDLIKSMRLELGMTQAEFARLAGINSFQQVSGLESGRRKVGFGLLNKIVSNLAANGYLVSLDIIVSVNNKRFK